MIWVALQKTFIASSASSAPSTLGVAMSISTSCAISGHVCSTCRCTRAQHERRGHRLDGSSSTGCHRRL